MNISKLECFILGLSIPIMAGGADGEAYLFGILGFSAVAGNLLAQRVCEKMAARKYATDGTIGKTTYAKGDLCPNPACKLALWVDDEDNTKAVCDSCGWRSRWVENPPPHSINYEVAQNENQ